MLDPWTRLPDDIPREERERRPGPLQHHAVVMLSWLKIPGKVEGIR